MKLLMRHDGTYLIPSSEDSAENYEKLKRGQEYTVEVKEARNPKFHRLAFALIGAMFESQEQYDDPEIFRRQLKKMCGSYDEWIDDKGKVWFIEHSWSWADMDDIAFHEIYNKLLAIATKRFGDEFADRFA